MAEAPKYFIQVPVTTARAKNLSSTDKLVFGEIFTMLNTEKRCWLTNSGIGDRINKNKTTIRNSVKKLKTLGYLKTKVISNGQENSKRFAYEPCVGGTKFGTTKESTPVAPNKVRRSYQIKYPSKSESISDSRREKRRQAQADTLLNLFQQFWAEDPGLKFTHYMNRWIANEPPAKIINAMKYARKNCRTSNPNAIASYMNGCLEYPMKSKKQSNHKSRGDNNGDEKYNHKAIFK